MTRSNVTKNKASISKKHKQSKKQEQKREKKMVPKITEGMKKEVSLVRPATPESFPILGEDSTAVQEITFLYKEEEKKDPEFVEVDQWLREVGEEKGGESDEE